MPSILGPLLWPLRWLIECVLVGIHQLLTGSGVPLESGTVWLISIIALLLIVKSAALRLIVLATLPFTEADRVVRMQTTVQQHPLRPGTKRTDPPGDEHAPRARWP